MTNQLLERHVGALTRDADENTIARAAAVWRDPDAYDDLGSYSPPAWIRRIVPAPADPVHLVRWRSLAAMAAVVPGWLSTATEDAVRFALNNNRFLLGVESWLADPATNLMLIAPSGSGKTTAAAHALRQYGCSHLADRYLADVGALCAGLPDVATTDGIEARMRRVTTPERFAESNVLWVTAYNLTESARQHPLGEGEAPTVANARAMRILVLDDLGNERPGAEVLLSVLDSRYTSGLATIVTTGMRLPELSARYGDALLRRLTETGGKAATCVDLYQPRDQAIQ
jgi:hypothetical protein